MRDCDKRQRRHSNVAVNPLCRLAAASKGRGAASTSAVEVSGTGQNAGAAHDRTRFFIGLSHTLEPVANGGLCFCPIGGSINAKTAPAWGRRGRQTSGEVSPRNGGHWGWGSGEPAKLARACVTNTSVPTVGRSGISADTAHSSVPQKLSCGGSATAPTIPTTSRSSDRSADTPTPPRSNHRVAPLRRRHRRIKSAAARSPLCVYSGGPVVGR